MTDNRLAEAEAILRELVNDYIAHYVAYTHEYECTHCKRFAFADSGDIEHKAECPMSKARDYLIRNGVLCPGEEENAS